MSSVRKRGRVWYYRFVDSEGVRHERKGCPDKRETESMAAASEAEASKIRAGLIDSKAFGYRDHEARTLADHLAEWRGGMLARGMTARHADQYHTRAARVVALARGGSLDDIDPPGRKPETLGRAARVLADAVKAARLSDLTPGRIQSALARLHDAGKSHQTVNHYRAAVRAFVRWCGDNGRLRDNPTRGVAGFNVDADRRHRRRALTPDEATRLVRAADRGPVVMGMPGPDRARLYALALGTGFRAAELAALTPERFDLTGDPATATVPAAYTKNGREAVQPLPPALARRLAPWVASLPPSRPVFDPMPVKTAEMIRVDLAAAGIEYETPSGVCDFHSLRGVYISNLVASGASVKTCQTLARHSTPSLTIGIYAKASLHDISGAVAALPDPTPEAPTPEAVASTGTDGRRISKLFAPPLPHEGDGTRRFGADTGGLNENSPESGERRNPLACRVLSYSDGVGRGEAPGGFEPPMEVLQTSALPLGYGAGEEGRSSYRSVRRAASWVCQGTRCADRVRRWSGCRDRFLSRRVDGLDGESAPRPRSSRLPTRLRTLRTKEAGGRKLGTRLSVRTRLPLTSSPDPVKGDGQDQVDDLVGDQDAPQDRGGHRLDHLRTDTRGPQHRGEAESKNSPRPRLISTSSIINGRPDLPSKVTRASRRSRPEGRTKNGSRSSSSSRSRESRSGPSTSSSVATPSGSSAMRITGGHRTWKTIRARCAAGAGDRRRSGGDAERIGNAPAMTASRVGDA